MRLLDSIESTAARLIEATRQLRVEVLTKQAAPGDSLCPQCGTRPVTTPGTTYCTACAMGNRQDGIATVRASRAPRYAMRSCVGCKATYQPTSPKQRRCAACRAVRA